MIGRTGDEHGNHVNFKASWFCAIKFSLMKAYIEKKGEMTASIWILKSRRFRVVKIPIFAGRRMKTTAGCDMSCTGISTRQNLCLNYNDGLSMLYELLLVFFSLWGVRYQLATRLVLYRACRSSQFRKRRVIIKTHGFVLVRDMDQLRTIRGLKGG